MIGTQIGRCCLAMIGENGGADGELGEELLIESNSKVVLGCSLINELANDKEPSNC